MEYKLLSKIKSPDDVKKLNYDEISLLCQEIRDCIVSTVSKNGGHLASNLGAVELTVALHRSFSSPEDALIFDVGHQSYTHKLLTGRFDRFSSIRTENGLSGYMRPDESEHDPFITGHSSNSISAAYGIYRAKKLKGEEGTAVAVIGDGAMTGGMAYEALNNAGSGRSNFIVVLNDNKMSISRNVGALARSLTKMRNKPHYHHFKFALSRFLLAIPLIGRPLNNAIFTVKEAVKELVYHENIFSALGFNYLGPVDGHDVKAMEQLFDIAKSYSRPSVIHVITTKGKGYAYAESSPKDYHGVSAFDIDKGAKFGGKRTYSDVAGAALCKIAERDERVCAITAAMAAGTGLAEFAGRFKSRFFDVGIAEGHAVTFSGGMAKDGLQPFCNIYSSFMQRAHDNIIHDVAIQNLPVVLCLDRAGLVGEDGPTHHGAFDMACLRPIPNLTICSPMDEHELRRLMYTAQLPDKGPFVIRYPRGRGVLVDWKCPLEEIPVGKGRKLKEGSDLAVITIGPIGNVAARAITRAEADLGLSIAHYDLRFLKPLDEELLHEVGRKFQRILTIEDGIIKGGMGSAVLEFMADNEYKPTVKRIGIPNIFVEHGAVAELYQLCGMDEEGILTKIKEFIN